jgi:hypothetical protein
VIGAAKIGTKEIGETEMATPRQSGNRGTGNRREQPARVKASLVKPLIPLGGVSEIVQKYAHNGGRRCTQRPLALRDILKSSKMVETIAVK